MQLLINDISELKLYATADRNIIQWQSQTACMLNYALVLRKKEVNIYVLYE